MSAFIVPCPHCAKPSQIDSAKLPDKPVFFNCPHCKGRVVVDKSKLGAQPQAPAARPTAPPASGHPSAITPPPVEPTVPDRRFAIVPPDAIFPSGIIVGEDEAVIGEIQEALATLGSRVEHIASADEARQTIADEQPELCICVTGEVQGAPHAPIAPLIRLHPSTRRSLYLVLVADNLKTSDGNAAFMLEVNMVLGKQDLPRIGAALYRGLDCHRRLYRTYLQALEQ